MQEITQRDQEAQIAKFETDLMNGAVYARAAASARSRHGYEPPVSRRDVADALEGIAKMTAESDALAQVADEIRINLYGTNSQAQAAIWEGIFRATEKGFDDVIGRSGPEGGRRGARPFTLYQRLAIYAYGKRIARKFDASVPTIGWCASALFEREHVYVPGANL